MGSYDVGKPEVCAWIRKNFPEDAEILDVGAGDGKWHRLLPEYRNMDAVEAWPQNLGSLSEYRKVYHTTIQNFMHGRYDLIIFGDVIEHLSVEDARCSLEYASQRCRDMIIAVPFLYPQGAIYGNPYEVHIQDDLTPELFDERYPGYEALVNTDSNYCYYHKRGGCQ